MLILRGNTTIYVKCDCACTSKHVCIYDFDYSETKNSNNFINYNVLPII